MTRHRLPVDAATWQRLVDGIQPFLLLEDALPTSPVRAGDVFEVLMLTPAGHTLRQRFTLTHVQRGLGLAHNWVAVGWQLQMKEAPC